MNYTHFYIDIALFTFMNGPASYLTIELKASIWNVPVTGNRLLNIITQGEAMVARFEITDWNGETRYAQYSTFKVAGPEDKYRLTISGYSGTAGR